MVFCSLVAAPPTVHPSSIQPVYTTEHQTQWQNIDLSQQFLSHQSCQLARFFNDIQLSFSLFLSFKAKLNADFQICVCLSSLPSDSSALFFSSSNPSINPPLLKEPIKAIMLISRGSEITGWIQTSTGEQRRVAHLHTRQSFRWVTITGFQEWDPSCCAVSAEQEALR